MASSISGHWIRNFARWNARAVQDHCQELRNEDYGKEDGILGSKSGPIRISTEAGPFFSFLTSLVEVWIFVTLWCASERTWSQLSIVNLAGGTKFNSQEGCRHCWAQVTRTKRANIESWNPLNKCAGGDYGCWEEIREAVWTYQTRGLKGLRCVIIRDPSPISPILWASAHLRDTSGTLTVFLRMI